MSLVLLKDLQLAPFFVLTSNISLSFFLFPQLNFATLESWVLSSAALYTSSMILGKSNPLSEPQFSFI